MTDERLKAVANGELIDRGGGLIYDSLLDITWLKDANLARSSTDPRYTLLAAVDAAATATGTGTNWGQIQD